MSERKRSVPAEWNERRRADCRISGNHERPLVDVLEHVPAHHGVRRAVDRDVAVVEQHDPAGEARDEIELVAHE